MSTTTLAAAYGAAAVLSGLLRLRRPAKGQQDRRVMATATFFNPGWYRAHIVPLARGVADEVVLVTDAVVEPTPGVTYCCPPRWATRLIGRAGAKFLWGLVTAVRRRPDWCVGYHLFPGAITALIIGRVIGRPVCYQMTGGPVEVIGGGYAAENRLLSMLGRPSGLVERLALAVVRRFDLIVVRGQKAKQYLDGVGVASPIEIIPGAVSPTVPTHEDPDPQILPVYDLLFVGRLTEVKQPEQFVRIVDVVRRSIPTIRAAIVGDGPMDSRLRRLAEKLDLTTRIEFLGTCKDVAPILARSRIFVLTSRSEGLPIAMLEAMAAGLPVVVADVGETADAVEQGRTGWRVVPGAIDDYASRIVSLLRQDSLYSHMSIAARERALALASPDAVSARWRHALDVMYSSLPDARGNFASANLN